MAHRNPIVWQSPIATDGSVTLVGDKSKDECDTLWVQSVDEAVERVLTEPNARPYAERLFLELNQLRRSIS